MICRECKTAGEIVRRFEEGVSLLNEKEAATAAEVEHAACSRPQCCCQHRVGAIINE